MVVFENQNGVEGKAFLLELQQRVLQHMGFIEDNERTPSESMKCTGEACIIFHETDLTCTVNMISCCVRVRVCVYIAFYACVDTFWFETVIFWLVLVTENPAWRLGLDLSVQVDVGTHQADGSTAEIKRAGQERTHPRDF